MNFVSLPIFPYLPLGHIGINITEKKKKKGKEEFGLATKTSITNQGPFIDVLIDGRIITREFVIMDKAGEWANSRSSFCINI
jgi:hypothetical protein